MIHPLKLANSSAKHRGGKGKVLLPGDSCNPSNRERDSRFTLPPQFASHSVRDSRRAGRPTCRPQRGPARNHQARRPKSAARINVATKGGSPESRRFPPFLRKLSLHKGRSHHCQVTRFEEGFAQRPRLRNADAYLFHESRGTRPQPVSAQSVGAGKANPLAADGKPKDPRTPESGLIGAAGFIKRYCQRSILPFKSQLQPFRGIPVARKSISTRPICRFDD
jgi:hypothetical protein